VANNVMISLSEYIFIPQHAHVIVVAFAVDVASFYSGFYGAVFFVVVEAVVEAALLHAFANLYKVVSYFCGLEVNVDEFADARSVDEISAEGEWMHLGEGGGVFAF
jgi:hypothetical protein